MHEYLPDHPGEGVQHLALATDDIFGCVEQLLANGVEFVEPPPRYYEQLDARLPGHGLDVERLKRTHVLVDGEIGRMVCRCCFSRLSCIAVRARFSSRSCNARDIMDSARATSARSRGRASKSAPEVRFRAASSAIR